ncbi:hypothetical protein ABZW18_09495 [Streptomyces sp. NPDC004647]|uniref:hypothetical protein n=1 Tax=Streptomyces sp. NPDC004647 TaxID=3154671 RepID=UPI0033BD1FC7
MSEHRRGWTLFCEEDPAEEIQVMPLSLQKAVINFLTRLALEAGNAIDAGKPPPGRPVEDLGIRYSVLVVGQPVIIEYTVIADIRELCVPSLVWIH